MSGFYISARRPEDIIPRLGKGELHWKKGRSAYELAYHWMGAGEIPPSIRSILAPIPDWSQAKILDAFFERETDLKSRGRPSQTDLLVLATMPQGRGVIAVEGKVDEPFGQPVCDWLKGDESESRGRHTRLSGLCSTLGLSLGACDALFYQLLHRTASAIYEAHNYGFPKAIMLIHSFSDRAAWFDEFSRFSTAMELPVNHPNSVSAAKICDGVELRLGWVTDDVQP